MEKARAMKKTSLFEYEIPATPKKRAMGLAPGHKQTR